MLLLKEANQSETGGLGERAAFKVEMNAMLFHSVIDGIYADKIRAPMRELTTNARDGHAAAGKLDVPFDVYLPSHLDPTFKVRDYGCSLSHEDIMGLYSTMFASSKRASNEAVGMIGLGSKSPFAYTSVFTVTAILDGEKRIYTAFIGDDGVPQIAMLDRNPTTEPTGIEVQFPVASEDIDKFRNAAKDVLFGFDPYPNVLNETYVRPEPKIIYQGGGWRMYDPATIPFGAKLMARQGCVLYPIAHDPLGMDYAGLFTFPIVIDFDIGQLSVSTSREALGYDERTIRNIKDRMQVVMDDLCKEAATELQNAPTYLEACQLFLDGQRYDHPKRPIYSLIASNPNFTGWNGQKLRTRFEIDSIGNGYQITHLDPGRITMGETRFSVLFSARKNKMIAFLPKTLAHQVKVVWEKDDCKFGPSRIRQMIADAHPQDHILWVRGTDFGDIKRQLADPEIIELSTVEPLKLGIKRDKNAVRAWNLRYLVPRSHRYDVEYSASYERIVPDPLMVYVRQEGTDFFPNSVPVSYSQLQQLLFDLKEAGLVEDWFRLYCLNKSSIKLLDTVKMKPLADFVREEIAAKININDVAAVTAPQNVSTALSLATNIERHNGGTALPQEITDFLKLAADHKSVAKAAVKDGTTNVLRQFAASEYQKACQTTYPLAAAHEELLKQFPLIVTASYAPHTFQHYMELLLK